MLKRRVTNSQTRHFQQLYYAALMTEDKIKKKKKIDFISNSYLVIAAQHAKKVTERSRRIIKKKF